LVNVLNLRRCREKAGRCRKNASGGNG